METHVSETILDEYYLGARAAMLLKKKRVKEKRCYYALSSVEGGLSST
jgi:hypothetical protein